MEDGCPNTRKECGFLTRSAGRRPPYEWVRATTSYPTALGKYDLEEKYRSKGFVGETCIHPEKPQRAAAPSHSSRAHLDRETWLVSRQRRGYAREQQVSRSRGWLSVDWLAGWMVGWLVGWTHPSSPNAKHAKLALQGGPAQPQPDLGHVLS